jgi:hypothetical protein
MSKELAEKIRAGRRFAVESGGVTYRCRRPTDFEAMTFQQDVNAFGIPAICARFVEGWTVTEHAITGEGDDEKPVPVTPELVAEWLADHAAAALHISTRLVEEYKARRESLDNAGN